MEAMRAGDFELAWQQTDRLEQIRRSKEQAGTFVWEPHYLLWNGDSLAGKCVAVRCNHGLGDTIQFARFLPEVSRIARTVTVLAQPPLVPLLKGIPGFGEVRNGWLEEPPDNTDAEVEIMEFAYIFRTTVAALPNRVPYLPAEQILTRARAIHFLRDGRAATMRIGLVWSSSDWDPRRSVPLELLRPLAAIPGTEFYSLQQGTASADWKKAPFPLHSLGAQTAGVLEAAAAMLQLDLILTVDSMTAHLAGALGRRTWLMLQKDADWRWMRDRADTPWYPTMQIFRQTRAGHWETVAAQIAARLAPVVGRE